MAHTVSARRGAHIPAVDAFIGPLTQIAQGFRSGYRAYLTYTALDQRSDRDLARMGLTRADLPRVAFEAMR